MNKGCLFILLSIAGFFQLSGQNPEKPFYYGFSMGAGIGYLIASGNQTTDFITRGSFRNEVFKPDLGGAIGFTCSKILSKKVSLGFGIQSEYVTTSSSADYYLKSDASYYWTHHTPTHYQFDMYSFPIYGMYRIFSKSTLMMEFIAGGNYSFLLANSSGGYFEYTNPNAPHSVVEKRSIYLRYVSILTGIRLSWQQNKNTLIFGEMRYSYGLNNLAVYDYKKEIFMTGFFHIGVCTRFRHTEP